MAKGYINRKCQINDDMAIIKYKNFSGANNENGAMDFTIQVPEEMAQQMIADEWFVKPYVPKDEEEPIWLLKVKVKYGDYPPNLFMICGGKKTPLTAETVKTLDGCRIIGFDVIVQQSHWTYLNKTGVAAYVTNGIFVIDEADVFVSKYDNLVEEPEDEIF